MNAPLKHLSYHARLALVVGACVLASLAFVALVVRPTSQRAEQYPLFPDDERFDSHAISGPLDCLRVLPPGGRVSIRVTGRQIVGAALEPTRFEFRANDGRMTTYLLYATRLRAGPCILDVVYPQRAQADFLFRLSSEPSIAKNELWREATEEVQEMGDTEEEKHLAHQIAVEREEERRLGEELEHVRAALKADPIHAIPPSRQYDVEQDQRLKKFEAAEKPWRAQYHKVRALEARKPELFNARVRTVFAQKMKLWEQTPPRVVLIKGTIVGVTGSGFAILRMDDYTEEHGTPDHEAEGK